MDRSLRVALARLAQRLDQRLLELRKRGRTRGIDAIGGLAIEPGDAEGLLAELVRDDLEPLASVEPISAGVASFDHVARRFELTAFECDVLLLALAPEVEARFCRLFGFLNDSVVALRPTIGLAISVLAPGATARLAAFLPDARLVKLGLVACEGDAPLAGRSIRIASDLWPRLAGLRSSAIRSPAPPDIATLSPSTALGLSAAVRAIRDGLNPLVVVTGDRATAIVRSVVVPIGSAVALDDVTARDPELRQRVMRDAIWEGLPIAVESGVPLDVLRSLVRDARVPIVAAISESELAEVLAFVDRPLIEVTSAEIDEHGRAQVWRSHGADQLGLEPDALANRFRFSPERVSAVVTLAKARAEARGDLVPDRDDVLGACRSLASIGNTKLARKLDTSYAAEDLVLASATQRELALFETAARHGHRLFGRDRRGGEIRGASGFIAMFAGPPGTGKTMAAQVVARRLEVDLFRIDLSQVVDKYIGETEKHLDKVFRDAAASGAMLFFDEADALFGKRTEVKDAHDRYSNIETAFLLQRLEQHPGIAVLATNLAKNLDAAFLRRLHFFIEFPMPGLSERRAIWERHLVKATLDSEVDLGFLARFELSGGDIRNAAVAAVLLSSDSDRIGMPHLAIATSRELRKAGRLAQPEEFGRWRDAVMAHMRGERYQLPVQEASIEQGPNDARSM